MFFQECGCFPEKRPVIQDIVFDFSNKYPRYKKIIKKNSVKSEIAIDFMNCICYNIIRSRQRHRAYVRCCPSGEEQSCRTLRLK